MVTKALVVDEDLEAIQIEDGRLKVDAEITVDSVPICENLIILWRPLVDGEEICIPHPYNGYTMNFNREEFFTHISNLTHYWDYYEIEAIRPNWAFVMEK